MIPKKNFTPDVHSIKQRNGKTEVTVDLMFTPQELAELTPLEIEDRMNSLLAHDDYIWNKEKQYSYLDNGDGMLSLDAEGLHFSGRQDGEALSFDIPTGALPTFGMCTDISRFYTFVKGEFIEFYPDRRDALRWDHLTEEMHRFRNGRWQNTPYRHV